MPNGMLMKGLRRNDDAMKTDACIVSLIQQLITDLHLFRLPLP